MPANAYYVDVSVMSIYELSFNLPETLK